MADSRGTKSDENEKRLINELASIIMQKTKFDLTKHSPGEKQDYSNLDDNFDKINGILFKTDRKFNTYAIQLQAINQVYNKITTDKSLVIGQHEYASVDKFFGKDESLTKRQIDAINILKRVYLKLALSIIWNAVDPNNSKEFSILTLKGVDILNDDLNNERSLVNCKTSEGSLSSKFESKSKETSTHIKLKDWLSEKKYYVKLNLKKRLRVLSHIVLMISFRSHLNMSSHLHSKCGEYLQPIRGELMKKKKTYQCNIMGYSHYFF